MLTAMQIRPVTPSELDRLRRIRLRALAESPDAYGSRHEDEATRPLSEWRRWLSEGATFVAEDRGEWIGLVAALVDRRDPEGFFVLSMWVDPRRRGEGLGRQLLDAAVSYAVHQGAVRVRLGVVEGNGAARHLYESAGFRATGEREPLRSDPSRTVVHLGLELAAQ